MCVYFSHDVDARCDVKCAKLISTLGYKGYGLFWAILELMNMQSDCKLPVDFKLLGWELHAYPKFIERVVREFDLFVFSEDGAWFWSESARRRAEMRKGVGASLKQSTGKRGRPPLRRDGVEYAPDSAVDAPKAGEPVILSPAQETQNRAETEPNSATVEIPPAETIGVPGAAQGDDLDAAEQAFPAERIVQMWNELFGKTPQRYRGSTLDSIAYQNAKQALDEGFELHLIQKAFRAAKADSFSWLLRDALKPDNLQRLLTKDYKRATQPQSGQSTYRYDEDEDDDQREDGGSYYGAVDYRALDAAKRVAERAARGLTAYGAPIDGKDEQ